MNEKPLEKSTGDEEQKTLLSKETQPLFDVVSEGEFYGSKQDM